MCYISAALKLFWSKSFIKMINFTPWWRYNNVSQEVFKIMAAIHILLQDQFKENFTCYEFKAANFSH